jgi:hypothetical protein
VFAPHLLRFPVARAVDERKWLHQGAVGNSSGPTERRPASGFVPESGDRETLIEMIIIRSMTAPASLVAH